MRKCATHNATGIIRRSIVDDDDLETFGLGLKERFDRIYDHPFLVMRRQDDGEARQGRRCRWPRPLTPRLPESNEADHQQPPDSKHYPGDEQDFQEAIE